MRKIRRFLAGVVKPLCMMAVAGIVALSLVVGGSNEAHASVILPPPVLLGSGAMPVADALALVAPTGPIGWTIAGVAVVGIAAYVTKDYWLPYVTGDFGAKTETAPSSSSNALTTSNLQLSKLVTTNGGSAVSSNATYTGTATTGGNVSYGYYIQQAIQCRKASDGSMYTKTFTSSGNFSPNTTKAFAFGCDLAADLILAAQFGAPCALTVSWVTPCTSKSTLYGPGNVVTWGVGDFDPHSAGTKYTVTSECIRADGTKFSISKDSTGDLGAVGVPACGAVDPGSHSTGKLDVVGTPPATSSQGPSTIYSVPAVPTAPGFELCATSAAGPGCVLSVQLDGKPCVVGQWECARWTQLKNDPNYTNRLSCQYGPYAVAISKCNVLERAYEVGGAPATSANIDGDPATRSDTDPNGQQVPRTDPNTGTGTGTGTGTAPGQAGTPSTVTGGASSDEAACWPSGWGMLNPLEWVYRPVVCAAKALFQPKTDLQTRVTTMQAQFANKVPISWFSITPDGVAGGACPTDWAIDFRGQHYSLICGTAADGILRSFRPVLGTMLTVAMLWPLIRSLFYSAIPVFKVTPS